MPRYSDRYDGDRPRKRKGLPTWAILLLVAFAVLLVGSGTLAVLSFKTEARKAASSWKPMERGEFRTMMMGKTEAEVIELLGKPTSTQDYAEASWWEYRSVTYDRITRKTDAMTGIKFKNGVVVEAR